MILSEKGKYFFDPEKKTEYTRSFHENIVSNLFGFPGRNPLKVSYSETIKNIEFPTKYTSNIYFKFQWEYIDKISN